MKKHYICKGSCGAESDKPGVCKDPDCEKKGQPFAACECEDGEHGRMEEGGDMTGDDDEEDK